MIPNFLKYQGNFLYILSSTSIFTLLIFLWHINNNYLPTSDAITYMQDAYVYFNSFAEKGFIQGINDLYTVRGWRPQIYPFIAI